MADDPSGPKRLDAGLRRAIVGMRGGIAPGY